MNLFLISVFFFMSSKSIMASQESLASQLLEKAEQSAKKTPKETKKIMSDAIEKLRQSEVLKTSLKQGVLIPDFILEDVNKGFISSKNLRKKGPLILTFYRGGWCPYCNLQLRDLQLHLKEIKELGAELVAISPEKPDQTAQTIKKEDLQFYVLSDNQGKVAKSFGLTYKLPQDLISVYKKFGIDLEKTNGNSKWELPISATYIVNKSGKIIFAFIDADYKKRAETSELIKILKKINN